MNDTGAPKIGVLHSLPVWLPLTSTWLHALIGKLPPRVVSHIACESTSHAERFPIQNLHVLKQRSMTRYLVYRLSRRFSWRQYFGYSADVAVRVGASILHSHFGDVGWKDWRGANRKRLIHLVTFYGKDANYLPQRFPVWRERYQQLFEHAAGVICEGPFMGRALQALGCPPEKINVLHLGTDTANIVFSPRSWRPDQRLRILIAASFREKKGIPFALAAIGELLSRGADIEVTIIGDASEDPRSKVEKAVILETIDRYHMRDRVRLIGYQTHQALFAESYQHHVFLSPSVTAADGDAEGGAPVSLIDMAATGMPIVSTTHCDIPEVIRHGETGLLAAERDVEGLVLHLEWLMKNPAAWRPMLEAGRRHMEREFDVGVQAARVADLYGRIYASVRHGRDHQPGKEMPPSAR